MKTEIIKWHTLDEQWPEHHDDSLSVLTRDWSPDDDGERAYCLHHGCMAIVECENNHPVHVGFDAVDNSEIEGEIIAWAHGPTGDAFIPDRPGALIDEMRMPAQPAITDALLTEGSTLIDELRAEVKRLTKALAAANADRDRMAQEFATLNQQYWNEHTDRVTAETNLGIAQSEARGLRQALHDLSIPTDGAI